MIKALIFDVSGVLTQARFSRVYESFAKRLELPVSLIDTYFKGSLEDQLLGNGNLHDMYAGLTNHIPGITEGEFRKLLVATITELTTVNTELLEWINSWRKSYTCGILTNNTEGRGIFDESIGLHQHFDFVLESYKEHMKKPDPQFFLVGLTEAGCKPEEALYIDDQQRHVDAAQSIGMQGLVFTNNTLFKQALSDLGAK